MSIMISLKRNPYYYFQRFMEILRTLRNTFILTFLTASIYLLYNKITFYSLKVCFYYFLAKFYVWIRFPDVTIDVKSRLGKAYAIKSINMITNIGAKEVYNEVINSILSSIVTGLSWGLLAIISMILFFNAKVFWKYNKKAILDIGLVRKSLIKINQATADLLNLSSHPIKIIQDQTIRAQQSPAPSTKPRNIEPDKKLEAKSEDYKLISDENLPYPILKRVEFTEKKLDSESSKSKEVNTKSTGIKPKNKPAIDDIY